MEDTEAQQYVSLELEKLDAKIAWYEGKLVELRRVRDAFIVVSDTLRTSTDDVSNYKIASSFVDGLVDSEVHDAEAVPLSETAETSYGDMAKTMRKYIVQGISRMRTRKEIVEAARGMDASSNFPYRFLKRMLDTGELVEVSRGQYAATPKMVKKVEGI